MVRQKESQPNNAKIAIVFFIFLGVIAGISLIFKIILIVRAGQFDDSRRFTISVSDNKIVEVMSLSPSSKSIAIFKLDKGIKLADTGRFLKIPIDGFIASNSLDLSQKATPFFLRAALNYGNLYTNLTILDIARLLLFARAVPEREISMRKIPQDLSAVETDKIVGRQVRDELIEKDNLTIRIINGTDIIGFGNRLARFITNMGGNVIIVATSDRPVKRSAISYIDKETYTVKRLVQVLEYEAIRENNNAISDITITIGEDRASISAF